jgi:DNA repair exonuclease SbcCD nuclease subunit
MSIRGNNQRGEDVVRSFINVISDIEASDPDIVIHAGDVGDRPKIDIRFMLVAQRLFKRLTVRPDGSARPVIVIAGNHDLPRSRKEACWLELLAQIPHVYVECHDYRVVDLGERGYSNCGDIMMHMLPHDTLRDVDFSLIQPVAGKRNILTSHGTAAGSELFKRGLGREFSIPEDVLGREWEYAALGHFHKRGPITLSGMLQPRIWYSGSSENISFSDLRENDTPRGYLQVTSVPGEDIVVTPVDLPIRRMLRLPVVEASNLSPAEIAETLLARLLDSDIHDAVVGQVVEGVTRDVWSLVDSAKVRASAADALHYEITLRYAKVAELGEPGTRGLGDLGLVLEEEIEKEVSEPMRAEVRELARTLLGAALLVGDTATEESSDGEDGVVGSGELGGADRVLVDASGATASTTTPTPTTTRTPTTTAATPARAARVKKATTSATATTTAQGAPKGGAKKGTTSKSKGDRK